MVLIAASVITKNGRALVTRSFFGDMTRARLEGLTDSFGKLVATDKSQRQHTFVETDSVRYVYQPLDQVYMVLITTKASNILEDLETLRLFSRVIPEYCRSNEESEIMDKVFDLIFAFDEIVSLGYRESVNLAQVRTFTEMDSHEERVYNQIQIAQQKAALSAMNEKVKEIKRAEKLKRNVRMHGIGSGVLSSSTAISSSVGGSGISSKDFNSGSSFSSSTAVKAATKPAAVVGGGKALKLGSKTTTEDIFLEQLRSEGQELLSAKAKTGDVAVAAAVSTVKHSAVHFKCVEKLNAAISREGLLKSCEVLGSVSLVLSDSAFCAIETKMKNQAPENVQFQVHPNLDKAVWQSASVLKLKSEQKPFPVNVDVGVLKWRTRLTDSNALPLTFAFWVSEEADGFSMNIEYTLQNDDVDWQLNNVTLSIPLPAATTPNVSECGEGTYEYLHTKSLLVWNIEIIDSSNKNGTLEFSTPNGHVDHFFPAVLRFSSAKMFSNLAVEGVRLMSSKEPVEFSSECMLVTDKFEILEN